MNNPMPKALGNPADSAEQRSVVLEGRHVTYTLKRSGKRRSIGLRIDGQGLTVSMPLKASESWLHEVLQQRAGWVIDKLEDWQAHAPEKPVWKDGEIIHYLGEILTLRLGPFPKAVQLAGDELLVRDEGSESRIEKRVSGWYREQALPLFIERAEHYARILDVSPSSIRLTTAKTRWGSCTSMGEVRLNVQLVKLPYYLIDYVIVHELAHLREMNHSQAFWRIVETACPNYHRLRSELKAISL